MRKLFHLRNRILAGRTRANAMFFINRIDNGGK